MKKTWHMILIGALAILAGQVIGVRFDFYTGDFVWFDLLLNLLSGAILAAIWIAISDMKVQTSSLLFYTFLAGSFALFGSFVWEVFELTANQTVPGLAAEYSLRSSTVPDAIFDMLSGLIGGLIWGFFSFNKKD